MLKCCILLMQHFSFESLFYFIIFEAFSFPCLFVSHQLPPTPTVLRWFMVPYLIRNGANIFLCVLCLICLLEWFHINFLNKWALVFWFISFHKYHSLVFSDPVKNSWTVSSLFVLHRMSNAILSEGFWSLPVGIMWPITVISL